MSQNGQEQMKRLESLIKLGSKDAIKDTDFVTSDELSKWFSGVVEVVKTLKESNDSTVQDILSHLSKIDKLVNNETQLTKKEQESLKNDLVSLKGELSKKLEDIRKDIPKEKDDVDLSLIPQETPISIKRKLESLKGEHAFDITKAKGTDKFMTKETLERAVGILDSRTSFLINKINEVQKSVGNSGNSLSATNGQYKIFVTVGSSDADYLTGDYASDYLALQAAIDYASSNGPGTVCVLDVLNIDGQVDLASNVNLIGLGYSSQLLFSAINVGLKASSVSKITISNLYLNGNTQIAIPGNGGRGLWILNSSDIRVENCYFDQMNRFGIFITTAGAGAVCERIWITNTYLQGNGNNDVIGGGPDSSVDGSEVRDIFITNNEVIQDMTTGTYDTAIDIVASKSIIYSGNRTKGNIHIGNEQYPHLNVNVTDNIVWPAINNVFGDIRISATSGSLSSAESIIVNSNNLKNGQIIFVGVSGFPITNSTLNGNTIKTSTLQNGIDLRFVSNASLNGNSINGASAAVRTINCDNITVNGNSMTNGNYGFKDDSAEPTINVSNNSIDNMAITNVICSGTVFNNTDTDNLILEDSTFPIVNVTSLRVLESDGTYAKVISASNTAPAQDFQYLADYTRQVGASGVNAYYGLNSDITTHRFYSKWSGINTELFTIGNTGLIDAINRIRTTNATTANGIEVDQNGNVGTDVSIDGAIHVENTGQTGIGLGIYTNIAAGAAALIEFKADNSTFDQNVLKATQDGTADGVFFVKNGLGNKNVYLDTNNAATALRIDTDTTNVNNGSENGINLTYTSVVNDGATYTKSGSIVSIVSDVTETSGTITDTAIVLSVNQTHADASGNLIFANMDGTGKAIFVDHDDTGTNPSMDIDRDGNNAGTITGMKINTANAGAGVARSIWVEAGTTQLDGSLQCDSIVNDTGLAAGVYTPTRSAEANLDANVTMSEAQYMRVGNTVTVSGRFTADPTLTTTATSFEFTLPIASNIGAVEDCAGVAFAGGIAGQGAAILGSVANNTAVVNWIAVDVTSQAWSYNFSYQVI